MRNFNQRSNESELMDDAGISFEEFHDCLIGLESINHLTLAYRPTLHWLKPWLKSSAKTREPLHILDVASGGGDMLRKIAKKSMAPRAATLRLTGVDLNPWSKKSAEIFSQMAASSVVATPVEALVTTPVTTPVSRSPQRLIDNISYETANIFEFKPAQPIDIVISSLFTHHLSDAQIVDFLRWMDTHARKGWFINDLHRHALPYYFIKAATAVFSRNRLIRNDAAVSVARSFSRADWQKLIHEARLDGRVRIQWFFPFRLCIACEKNSHTFSGDAP